MESKIGKTTIQTLEGISMRWEDEMKVGWKINSKWESFRGKWNADWKVGDVITGLFVSGTRKDGSSYYSIKKPDGGAPSQPSMNPMFNPKLDEILVIVKDIQSRLSKDEYIPPVGSTGDITTEDVEMI